MFGLVVPIPTLLLKNPAPNEPVRLELMFPLAVICLKLKSLVIVRAFVVIVPLELILEPVMSPPLYRFAPTFKSPSLAGIPKVSPICNL